MKTRSIRRSFARTRPPGGFSLLEVILALAILGGSVAVLGEVLRMGMHAAKSARDLTQAQLLCESLMDEVVTGLVPLDSVQDVVFEFEIGSDSTGWMYSIDYATTEDEGLYVVTVTVRQNLPEENRPVSFSLVRWLPDPAIEPGTATGTTGGSTDGNASGGSDGGATTPGSSASSGTSSEDLWAGFE